MKHLGHIDHKIITGEYNDILNKEFLVRQAVRSVISRQDKKIAMVYSSKFDTYKIPGGGIEKGESLIEALKREALEETGLEISINLPLGLVTELRTDFSKFEKGMFQFSYAFLANYDKNLQDVSYTESELEEGFSWEWIEIHEVIKHMKSSKTNSYNKKFESARDLLILNEVKTLIK